MTAADPTSDFFDELAGLGRDPRLGRLAGSIRFDLDGDGRARHWRVEVSRGAVTVSRGDGPADCVVRATRQLFEDLVGGRTNAMAAFLRGQLVADGDPALFIRFQRLFPAPTGPRVTASTRTVGKRRG